MPTDIKDDGQPHFAVRSCSCGGVDCKSALFAMIRPAIVPMEGKPDELVCTMSFPLKHAQELVDQLRTMAAKMGIVIV